MNRDFETLAFTLGHFIPTCYLLQK